MATLPTVQSFGDRRTPNLVRPAAFVDPGAAAGPAVALQRIGAQLVDIGDVAFDREATAAAKERDVYASDQIRKLLYDPETGFANKSGSAAVGAYASTQAALSQIRESAMKGLNPTAKRKLESQLQARMDAALGIVDRHTSGERRTWLDTTSAARIEAARQDAMFDVPGTEAHLNTIRAELLGQAQREGWDRDVYDLKFKAKASEVYAAQIERVANVDPVSALTYLQENRDKMLPADVLKIEGYLVPEAKKFLGREKGRAAALGGVSSDYLAAIKAAESGGSATAKNPLSSATGLYQFTTGTWASVMAAHPTLGLTTDGRTDPAQQELAIRAFTADNAKALVANGISPTSANLYAAHFLGRVGASAVLVSSDDTAMSDLVGQAAVDANPFLADMSVADFKAWTLRKAGGGVGFQENPTGIQSLLEIPDPLERDAALEEYALRTKVAAAETKARQDAAGNAAYQGVLQGIDPRTMSLTDQAAMGQDSMSALLTLHGKMLAKEPVVTDPSTYYMLNRMMVEDPAGFAQENLMPYVDKLSPSDWQEMVRKQGAPEEGSAASTLMETANRKLRAAGVDTGASANDRNLNRTATVQTRMLKWQDNFIKANGRKPTMLEVDEEAGRQVLDVTINPPGFWNEFSGQRFDTVGAEIPPDALGKSEITIGDVTVPQAVVQEQVDAMQAEGIELTAENLTERLIALMGN